MKKFSIFYFQFSNARKGQALITLLFFVLIGVTVTSAAIVILFTNSLSSSKLEQGTDAYIVAESGMENAILRLLRDPNYKGETFSLAGGTATSTISGTTNVTITATGSAQNTLRTIQVQAKYVTGVLTLTSWKETY